jgi:hypothetical protein
LITQFDEELDGVLEALAQETRRELMAFYVNEAISPPAIARTVKKDIAKLNYHTQALMNVGAVEMRGAKATDQAAPPRYAATELGQIAYLKLTGNGDG